MDEVKVKRTRKPWSEEQKANRRALIAKLKAEGKKWGKPKTNNEVN